jgi:anti-sigma factor RsiW
MTRKLTQAEWADLSAWMDGELPADRADEIESLVASDDAWAAALADLRAIDETLSGGSAPAAPADLEQQVLAFVRENALSDEDLAELSAWMDGELDDTDAARVAGHVVAEPAWRRAHEELRQVDEAMDVLSVPPCPADLPGRIVAATTGRGYDWAGLRRAVFSAPGAVAAMVAVLLAVYLLVNAFSTTPGIDPEGGNGTNVVRNADESNTAPDAKLAPGTEEVVEKELAEYDRVEQFAIMNREMIQNYDVIENLDVLAEMERIDSQGDS